MTTAPNPVDLTKIDIVEQIKKYVLHPNFILRVAGAPTSHIEKMQSDIAYRNVQKLIKTDEWLNREKESLCEIIELKIPEIKDKKLSHFAINTRRKLFQNNFNKVMNIGCLEDYLSPQQLKAFIRADEKISNRLQLIHDLDMAYAKDIDAAKLALKQAFSDPAIRNAILFSNTRVYESLVAYCDGDKKLKAKKERALLATLLSYVSRASTKTSPLSSFTTIHLGSWQKTSNNDAFAIDFQEDKTTSVVSIKTGIIKALFNPLFKDISQVGNAFKYQLNSSLITANGNASLKRVEDYFDSNSSAFGHVERTSEFAISPIISKLFGIFQGVNSLSLGEIRTFFAVDIGIKDNVKVDGFIQKIINEQILLPALARAEQGDILADHIEFLSLIPSEKGQPLIDQLTVLKITLVAYENATITERVDLKKRIEHICANLNNELERDLPAKVLNSCFYEDCYRLEANTKLHEGEMTAIESDLKKLLTITPLFDFNCRLQSILANMFVQKYGEKGVCDDVTQFLSQAQDELQCTGVIFFDKHIIEKFKETFEEDQSAKILDDLNSQFMDHLIDKIEQKSNFIVDENLLKEISEKIPTIFQNRVQSHCFFGQIAKSNEGSNFVLNQSYTGHSNFFSRFLHHSSNDDLEEIKQYLNGLSRYGDYMELPGVFGFNANLHSQLADKELAIEPFGYNYKDSEKLKLDSLSLIYDKKTHRIYFDSKEHGKLDLFYFGFLSPIYLPKLFKILSLSYSQGILSYVISELISRGIVNKETVTYVPRINLGKVVMWRESWLVPKALIPAIDCSEIDFFKQVNLWRVEHDLPLRSYVRFTPKVYTDNVNGSSNSEDMASIDFKKIKPLYVDFTNPLLIQAFKKTLANEYTSITFQEALPALNDNQASITEKSYVSEFQIEISKHGVRG